MNVPETGLLAAYFQEAQDSFSALAQRDATVSHHYSVAGLKLKLEISGGLFDRLISRALTHLVVAAFDDPDLTICAWDSETTGLAALRPGWPANAYDRLGMIDGFNNARFHTAVQPDPAILRMLDRQRGLAIYWTHAARTLPYWEIGAPLRPLLHEWLRGQGRLPVHGGAVGTDRGAVFLAGAGGSGKSNLALACLVAGLRYASDDFCVLTADPDWHVHSLYSTGKIAGTDLVRHPRLAAHVSNPDALDHEKALFFLNEIQPENIVRTMPVRAIFLPQVVGSGASKIVPATKADAQRAIAMSTIELSRWTAATTFGQVAQFVRQRPAFRLMIGEDIHAVPAMIRDFLDQC